VREEERKWGKVMSKEVEKDDKKIANCGERGGGVRGREAEEGGDGGVSGTRGMHLGRASGEGGMGGITEGVWGGGDVGREERVEGWRVGRESEEGRWVRCRRTGRGR